MPRYLVKDLTLYLANTHVHIKKHPEMYKCVECNHETKSIKKKLSTNYQIVKCLNIECGEKTDKYYEYNSVMCLIDLLLMKKEIFRHYVYNLDVESKYMLHKFWISSIMCKVLYDYDEYIVSADSIFFAVGRFIISIAISSFFMLLYVFVLRIIYYSTINGKILFAAVAFSDYYYFLLPFFVIWNYNYEYKIVIEILTIVSNSVVLTAITEVPFMINMQNVLVCKLIIFLLRCFIF